jgi:hypothetical protein
LVIFNYINLIIAIQQPIIFARISKSRNLVTKSAFISYVVGAETKNIEEVGMKPDTNPHALNRLDQAEGYAFDFGRLYGYLQRVYYKRKPKGLRYPLAVTLTLIVLTKLAGQDRPSGIAEWAQIRAEMLAKASNLRGAKMLHHSTYQWILVDVIAVSELEAMVSRSLKSRPKAGRSVVIVMDGKTLRGSIPSAPGRGMHLIAAICRWRSWYGRKSKWTAK